MQGAFTDAPDYTPFTAVPNRVPLTDGLTAMPTRGPDTVAGANVSTAPAQTSPATVPANEQHVADLWNAWVKGQPLTGANAIPDSANPEQMDHYTWYAAHGWTQPYPGEKKILTPAEVPGRYLPSPDYDG